MVVVVAVVETKGDTVSPQTTTRTLRQALQDALDALDSEDTPREGQMTICLEMMGRRFPVGDDFPDVNFTLDVPEPEEDRMIRLRVEAPRRAVLESLLFKTTMIYDAQESGDKFVTSSKLLWNEDLPMLFALFPFLPEGHNFHIRV